MLCKVYSFCASEEREPVRVGFKICVEGAPFSGRYHFPSILVRASFSCAPASESLPFHSPKIHSVSSIYSRFNRIIFTIYGVKVYAKHFKTVKNLIYLQGFFSVFKFREKARSDIAHGGSFYLSESQLFSAILYSFRN